MLIDNDVEWLRMAKLALNTANEFHSKRDIFGIHTVKGYSQKLLRK